MKDGYQKYVLQVTYINEEYKYWKKVGTACTLWLETYKNKRAIYINVENLLPSKVLSLDNKGDYVMALVGSKDGVPIRKTLGRLVVDSKGDGAKYEKFSGEELSCYSSFFLMAGDEEVVLEGRTPFYDKIMKAEEAAANPWLKIFDEALKGNKTEIFNPDFDETKADWYIVPFDGTPYGHMALGVGRDGRRYVAVPGRFLIEERPDCDEGPLTLWQPLRDGEKYFDRPEDMDDTLVNHVYGYWIGEISETGKFQVI